MMPTFHELWLQRNYFARSLLDADRDLATFVVDEEQHEIEDLKDPHGKRFLFDDIEGVPQQSTLPVEASSASSLAPNLGNQLKWGRMRLRACSASCVCACGRCAWIRAVTHHAAHGQYLS